MANRTFAIIISLLSMLVADVLAFPQGLEDRGLSECFWMDGEKIGWYETLIQSQAPTRARLLMG
jgi:hypothetical protein